MRDETEDPNQQIDLPGIAEAFVIRPGDTLVIRYNRNVTNDQADDVIQQIQTQLPGVKVLVLSAEQMAAYRPQEIREQALAGRISSAVDEATANPGRMVEVEDGPA